MKLLTQLKQIPQWNSYIILYFNIQFKFVSTKFIAVAITTGIAIGIATVSTTRDSTVEITIDNRS
jgi:hypothetical protein